MTTDNPFDLDFEEDETDEDQAKVNKSISDLRKYARAQKKLADEAIAENAVFRQEKAERDEATRVETIGQTFKTVGLNEKHAALFAKLNPEVEVTAEAVTAFATEYELPITAPAEGEAAPAPAASSGFTPVTTPAAPASGTISIEDARKLIREGKYDEAQKLYSEGRVEKLERDANGSPVVDWLAS